MNAGNIFIDSLNYLIPEIIVCLGIVLIVLVDLIFKKRIYLHVVSIIILIAAIIALLISFDKNNNLFPVEGNFLISVDPISSFFKLIFLASTLIIVFQSFLSLEIKNNEDRLGEYYTLMFGMLFGMMFMASANDFIVAYIAVEVLSLSSYVLSGFLKEVKRSNEAALKYVVYGGVSSGIMLFGISLIYGIAGSTNFADISSGIFHTNVHQLYLYLSLLMIFVGIGFKISAVPFHFWTPDVYEGAPLPITAFLSVASKAAGIILLIRFIAIGFASFNNLEIQAILNSVFSWKNLIGFIAVLSMTIGNLTAIWQSNVKRMLAYSGIAHAGYILAAVTVINESSLVAVNFYLLIYLFMNLGAFFILMFFSNAFKNEEIKSLSGLHKPFPIIAVAFSILFISLIGLPPTAGFVAKLYILFTLFDSSQYIVAIALLVNTVISLFYYVRVIKQIYFEPYTGSTEIKESSLQVTIAILFIIPILVLGVYFSPAINFIKSTILILGF